VRFLGSTCGICGPRWSIVSLDIADFITRRQTHFGRQHSGYLVLEAMRGCEVVVHCAAALPSYAPAEIMSTEVEGTRNVLRAAREIGISRAVHISSTAVYGTKASGATEDSETEIIGPYAEAKVLAENECVAYRELGMCIPILRPKTFVGPDGSVCGRFCSLGHSGCGFPLIGPGTNRYQLLDVEDLCDAIHASMVGEAGRVNSVFNVGAKDFGTMREDFQAVLDHAGHGKSVRPLPAGPIILCLKVLEKLKLSPVYEWVYETAAVDSTFRSSERAGARVSSALFQQGRVDQELRLVRGAPGDIPGNLRDFASRAVEAGADRPGEEVVLGSDPRPGQTPIPLLPRGPPVHSDVSEERFDGFVAGSRPQRDSMVGWCVCARETTGKPHVVPMDRAIGLRLANPNLVPARVPVEGEMKHRVRAPSSRRVVLVVVAWSRHSPLRQMSSCLCRCRRRATRGASSSGGYA
jgi:nucleoside-diphosphate-sugar epimerase